MKHLKTFSQLVGLALMMFLLAGIEPARAQQAQTGKVTVRVSPKQAYVFVDGNPVGDGDQSINLSTGTHTVGVYNYGFVPMTKDVQVTGGQTLEVPVMLTASGDKVAGPFGDIEFKGHPRAAVFLNGKTPSYFVGHVDEFDNNWIWHQWLLVKPGTYQVTVMEKDQTIWSGSVPVEAGQRVIVDLNDAGRMTTKDFPAGLKLGPQPRFSSGIASVSIPIAPVMATLSASQTAMTCGQSAMLNWKTEDAVDTSISNLGSVPADGGRSVNPTQTTTYHLVAKGPGGEVTQSATLDVNNPAPQATLTLSQPEVRYHKVGDKVVEQTSATLSWYTANGTKVAIQPFGDVTANGTRTIEAMPDRSSPGPIDREMTYTLNVSNACGTTATRTAMLREVGSIDPAPMPPAVTLASVFYSTNYPLRSRPKVGLVASQKQALTEAAAEFKKNEQFVKDDRLVVIGYADQRGPDKYNMALSQRRAELVRDYLISQGIEASKINIRAEGESEQISEKEVTALQSKDQEQPQKWMASKAKTTWLAYNRRVDITLEPAGQQSTKMYPNDVPAARVLWQRAEPSLKSVESFSSGTGTSQSTERAAR